MSQMDKALAIWEAFARWTISSALARMRRAICVVSITLALHKFDYPGMPLGVKESVIDFLLFISNFNDNRTPLRTEKHIYTSGTESENDIGMMLKKLRPITQQLGKDDRLMLYQSRPTNMEYHMFCAYHVSPD